MWDQTKLRAHITWEYAYMCIWQFTTGLVNYWQRRQAWNPMKNWLVLVITSHLIISNSVSWDMLLLSLCCVITVRKKATRKRNLQTMWTEKCKKVSGAACVAVKTTCTCKLWTEEMFSVMLQILLMVIKLNYLFIYLLTQQTVVVVVVVGVL
jgi:hypothetical protein